MAPSPRSHIYRLTIILVIALTAFLLLKDLAVPASWDATAWYRTDALTDLQQQPARFGGNESCRGSQCHEPKANHQARLDELQNSVHKTLACETCHGPLIDHAQGEHKVGDAHLARGKLCLRCHGALLGRAEKVAQFSPEFPIHKMMQVTEEKPCIDCHSPHAPK